MKNIQNKTAHNVGVCAETAPKTTQNLAISGKRTAIIAQNKQMCNIKRNVAVRKANGAVEYLSIEEVDMLVSEALTMRKGKRNALLVKTLFQTGMRISECLSVTPAKILPFEEGYIFDVIGKGKKRRKIACPMELANEMRAFCYDNKIEPEQRIFNINRHRAWQILQELKEKSGLPKRIFCHLLRHSNAIFSLKQTGNPQALKLHLGHADISMTLRYLSTLKAEDSLKVHQQINFNQRPNEDN